MRGTRDSFFGSVAVVVVVVAVEMGSSCSSGMFDGDFEDVCIGGCVVLCVLCVRFC